MSTFEVNVNSVQLCSAAFLPLLRQGSKKLVLNMYVKATFLGQVVGIANLCLTVEVSWARSLWHLQWRHIQPPLTRFRKRR